MEYQCFKRKGYMYHIAAYPIPYAFIITSLNLCGTCADIFWFGGKSLKDYEPFNLTHIFVLYHIGITAGKLYPSKYPGITYHLHSTLCRHFLCTDKDSLTRGCQDSGVAWRVIYLRVKSANELHLECLGFSLRWSCNHFTHFPPDGKVVHTILKMHYTANSC